jgi:hypothetical protein
MVECVIYMCWVFAEESTRLAYTGLLVELEQLLVTIIFYFLVTIGMP